MDAVWIRLYVVCTFSLRLNTIGLCLAFPHLFASMLVLEFFAFQIAVVVVVCVVAFSFHRILVAAFCSLYCVFNFLHRFTFCCHY